MMLKLTDDRRKVLGVSLGGIWIGDSDAECEASDNIGAILNVAQDLVSKRSWPAVETCHISLIDGPGNEPLMYAAAVYALRALLQRHNVLVCCHTGSRALAVCIMYLCAGSDRTWDRVLQQLTERIEVELPHINDVHRDAWKQVKELL